MADLDIMENDSKQYIAIVAAKWCEEAAAKR